MQRSIFACLALVLGGCVSFAPKKVELASHSVRVPFELVDNQPYARFRIADGPELKGLIDTGAELMAIRPGSAERAKVPSVQRRFTLIGTDGPRTRRVRVARIGRLQVGGVALSQLEAIFLPELDDIARDRGIQLDAVLGNALWGENLVTVDYPHGELVIEPGALPLPDGAEVVPANFDTGLPRVTLDVAGTRVDALVDSGCLGWLALPESFATRVPLKQPPVEDFGHRGANGKGANRLARLSGSVRIGRHELVDVPLELDAGEVSARICSNLLRHFAVTIDTRTHRMRFHREDARPIVVEAQQILGFVLQQRGSDTVVTALRPGMAASGIEVGDVIVGVKGRSDLDHLGAGEVLHVTLRRGDQKLTVDVPVYEVGKDSAQ